MEAASRLRWLTWGRFLTLGLTALVVRSVIPSARLGQAVSVVISLAGLAAVLVGVSRLGPGERRPGRWFAVALCLYFAGDLIFYFYLLVRESARPFPSWPTPCTSPTYPSSSARCSCSSAARTPAGTSPA